MKDHWGYEKTNEETAVIVRCKYCAKFEPLNVGEMGVCRLQRIVVVEQHFCSMGESGTKQTGT